MVYFNRKNDVVCTSNNPGNLCEVKQQGAVKVMALVGFDGEHVLPIHWFDENVTGEAYLKMLKDVIWPAVRWKKGLRVQPDRARVHTAHPSTEPA